MQTVMLHVATNQSGAQGWGMNVLKFIKIFETKTGVMAFRSIWNRSQKFKKFQGM